ncbi:TetR/AcrR family transcriptional regulator [Maribellus maritimus]|uniref:TetR/AcrR family transcriptional regulator n=1 Tax=Maribellus maritimus TaxID=2870838 RepID=UPI001EEBAF4D|nr:TetR/AcrR family transcriptional regulator [Maribellus maritimus]MCG6189473.1 TetR/AcrR family transcriptional regulator [Maribellus maritimus]
MELRERIIEEATKQFFQYGIRNVTMDDIAVSLGMSKRTVYETFKDKGTLVETCINNLTIREDKKVARVVSESANVIEAIFVFMREGTKAMNAINPVFFKDLEKLYPRLWKRVDTETKAKRLNLSARFLEKGIKEGFFRNDLNIEIVSKLFHEQMSLLIDETIFPRDKYNHSEIFQNMIINFTRGISTSNGIQIIDKILE